MSDTLDRKIIQLSQACIPEAVQLLKELIRIPHDYVDKPVEEGGDPLCGLSNHEGPRLEYLKSQVLALGAVDGPENIGLDDFGNLWWKVDDPDDGVPPEEKRVIWLDGHTDTVAALRPSWHQAIGGGIDPYLGLTDINKVDKEFLKSELGYLPPEDEWHHLVWGRGSADQLGGVVCQVFATRLLRQLRAEGALRGVVVWSFATVAEEDNDGGGPMYLMSQLKGAAPDRVPDVVILTEPTGSAKDGLVGIYRGQRGRMQIEVEVVGKSCHGSMPHEGRNPLEYGGAIVAEAAEAAGREGAFLTDEFLGAGTRTASWARLETPSDCAVPERFVFRLDRRLTVGEDPGTALREVEGLRGVRRARSAGLRVEVRVPTYDEPTWRGYRPGNAQVYPGWVTPEEHPAVRRAVEAYERVVGPLVREGGGVVPQALPERARVGRWVFSTDGVGVPVPTAGVREGALEVAEGKGWVEVGAFRHPAMFGIGPGVEENTHKVGECVDGRELGVVVGLLTATLLRPQRQPVSSRPPLI